MAKLRLILEKETRMPVWVRQALNGLELEIMEQGARPESKRI